MLYERTIPCIMRIANKANPMGRHITTRRLFIDRDSSPCENVILMMIGLLGLA
jgi:hypothetical protein